MNTRTKKWLIVLLSLTLLLTAFVGCKPSNDSTQDSSSGGGTVTPPKPEFVLENDRVEIENEEDLELLTPFNDFGIGEPVLSLSTEVKKFGEASVKVENFANSQFHSDNSWPSVEVFFKKPQDFSTKKYTQLHVYSEEDVPFVMDVQYSVDGYTGFKSNLRQINPGWNVIEITNGMSRDFTVPVDFSKVTSFIFSIYGHASEDCVYYIDDIVLSDESAMGSEDVYELVSLENTKYADAGKGSNRAVPYTMFQDSVASTPTVVELAENGKALLTQYADWHFLMIGAFNNTISHYSVFSVDFENVSDFEVEVGIAAEGGDYTDGGPRIAPSATMVRQKLQPGEKATLTIKVEDILKALQSKSEDLTLDNLAFFHIFSVGSNGINRTFAVSNIRLLTANGIVINDAERVDDQIAYLPTGEELKMKHIAVVEDIRAQYNALSEEAKALVKNLAVLETAEATISAFDDEDYANGVEELIANLPTVENVTLADVEAVAEVRTVYGSMSASIQTLVENYATLTALEAKLDQLTGEVVKNAIEQLPAVEDLVLANKVDVESVRSAFDALTDAQKAHVNNVAKLEALEAKITELLGGEAVVELINSLQTEGSFDADDIKAIVAARNAYNALADEQKAEVTNLDVLKAVEAKMFDIKTFSSVADANGMIAGLWGPLSECKVETGYVESIGGRTGGFGWYSTKYQEGALMSEDLNGDGYVNDQSNGYIGVQLSPVHAKSAYEALLSAGYTTIALDIYVESDAGGANFFCRAAYDGAFTWFDKKECNQWYTLELSLEMFVNNYHNIVSGDWFLLGSDINMSATLMTVYFSDLRVVGNSLIEEPIPGETPVEKVIAMIDALQVEGAYTGDTVVAILEAVEAYEALSEEEQAQVTNYEVLEAAKIRMFDIKMFSSEADANDMLAGLYGALSQCKLETGYVGTIGGRNGGFGYYSTKYAEGALMSEDANGDGYANDAAGGAYLSVKLAPTHAKSAYEALLAAGYTTIAFDIYIVADAGVVPIFSRLAYDGAFVWFGNQSFNEWHTLELSLEMFVNNYNAIASGEWYLLGSDLNTATELTTIYISDVRVKGGAEYPAPSVPEATPAEKVDALINALQLDVAFTGETVGAIIAAREAYEALTNEQKEEVTALATLEEAEARMLTVVDFTAENIGDFKAGLYGGYSACTMESGYTTEAIAGVEGTAWFSSKYAEGALLEDPNNDGYANDHQFIGIKYKAAHDKSAYQALLDAGYTTVSFSFYQVADAGSIGWSCWLSGEKFQWLGKAENNTWVNVEIALADFVKYFDEIHGYDKFYILGGDVNTATTLTTVYMTDVIVK